MKRAGIPYCTNEGQVTLTSNTLDAKGGTTATVIFVERHGSIIVMNVGDTDAWMVTNSTQRKLTVDHQPHVYFGNMTGFLGISQNLVELFLPLLDLR